LTSVVCADATTRVTLSIYRGRTPGNQIAGAQIIAVRTEAIGESTPRRNRCRVIEIPIAARIEGGSPGSRARSVAFERGAQSRPAPRGQLVLACSLPHYTASASGRTSHSGEIARVRGCNDPRGHALTPSGEERTIGPLPRHISSLSRVREMLWAALCLSCGTSPERIAPESLTRCWSDSFTAISRSGRNSCPNIV
jgi:hypothetical protein